MKNKTGFEFQLENAVKSACEQDIKSLDQEMKNYSYSFSPVLEKRMDKLIKQQKTRNTSRHYRWKYVLVAAVILLMNAVIVIANEEVRNKLGDLIISIYEECIEFKGNISGEDKKEEFEKYSLQYLPEGYQKVEENYNDLVEWVVKYVNESGNIILYSQSDSNASDVLVTYDGSSIDAISIRENEAWIVSEQEFLTILFEKGGYTFMISSQENMNEVIEMAENISIWEK